VATYRVAGASGGIFTWSAVYDDAANTLTLQADGTGRSTVSVAQTNGQARSAAFVQQTGDPPLPVPAGIDAPIAVTILVGSGPLVMTGVRLRTSGPADGTGGFVVLNESWVRT
jgi:hypothetical protein